MATVYITFEIAKDFEDWKEVFDDDQENLNENGIETCLLYTSPSPRDA